ncbi:hypothetical protein DDV21_002465 [Streptococcus chenjunshii]|uniref:Uncharacterized protein n=2 Tax=Streptococcus chenjunshii TaxID=2173853 RepID=A0A346NAG9_9STRE|nr:hypothetical protein [Streptococcus chenjunshii]AXQ78014.1 hypothetical protein DDV21_002465 [Streptococcus chenjunshii]
MALTDLQIQAVQSKVKTWNLLEIGTQKSVKGQKYEIVNTQDGTTEAIAVAPVVDGKTDYSQTAIVVAGTQLIGKEGFGEDAWNSTKNVIEARSGLTSQVDDISDFYDSTAAKLEKDHGGGTISNMSGFSQSGPAVAKVAAAHQVSKITNFMDWGASSSLYSKANPKGITAEEKTWLDKHATIYMDSTRDVTYLDGKSHGDIPYGKKYIIEGTGDWISDHDTAFPRIKGNGLDIDWYVKHGQFTSGMTREQVIKVARMKAKKAKGLDIKDPDTWFDSTDYRTYLLEYVKTYGDFAVEPTKAELLSSYKKTVKELRSQLKTATGSKRISLREELLRAVAQKARLHAEVKTEAVLQKLEEKKASFQADIEATRQAMYAVAEELSESEVTDLLSPYTMENLWDSQAEEQNRAELDAYKNRMMAFADKLDAAADNLIAADQEGAALFSAGSQ